jgi:hypothetical protein
MGMDRRSRELGETLGPALLAGVATLLDVANDGPSFAHAVAVGVLALAAALSGAAAVVSVGRFGPSLLGRRFARWRACGLAAAAGCLALEVGMRLGTPRLASDDTVRLGVLGGAWALLTGWVWGRRSWERLSEGMRVRAEEARGRAEGTSAVRWASSEAGKA